VSRLRTAGVFGTMLMVADPVVPELEITVQ
jgi:hypothetical protein